MAASRCRSGLRGAVNIAAEKSCVVTTDMLMDGVDFLLTEHAPQRIGRKSLAVNLSDEQQWGHRQIVAFVSVWRLLSCKEKLGRELLAGMLPLAAEFNCPIAGGDTNSWRESLVLSVTAIGEVAGPQAWRRSGAKPGDLLIATGSFGGSILGKHFDFQPRVKEALWLAEQTQIHAAIDVSDGLSLDLWRLTEASDCGAELFVAAIPIAPAAETLAEQDGKSPLEHALTDGEDFELLLAIAAEDWPRLFNAWTAGPFAATPLTQIGRFTAEAGLWQVTANGREPLAPAGICTVGVPHERIFLHRRQRSGDGTPRPSSRSRGGTRNNHRPDRHIGRGKHA